MTNRDPLLATQSAFRGDQGDQEAQEAQEAQETQEARYFSCRAFSSRVLFHRARPCPVGGLEMAV